jgi:hypothetical protein
MVIYEKRMSMSHKPALIAVILLLLSACSTQTLRQSALQSIHVDSSGKLSSCAQLFDKVDKSVLESGVVDVQARRVAGFPYLRTNRLLANLGQTISSDTLPVWLMQLRELDKEARRYELQNTSIKNVGDITIKKLDACADILMQADLQDPVQLEKIKHEVQVPDSYIQASRILGLYPVSRMFVNIGVKRLQKQIKKTFSQAAGERLNHGRLLTYAPEHETGLTSIAIARIIESSSQNSLSIPLFEKTDESLLFKQFAPVWQLDVHDDNDKFGVPVWSAEGELGIQTNRPKVYRHLSRAKINDQVLPQFNYVIWFPSRPAKSAFDILSGNLDGITWRVTVGLDGNVLMYDVMHNCGCYHMFFPPKGVSLTTMKNENREEPILVPQRAPELKNGERIHLRIASGSHYLEAVQAKPVSMDYKTYIFADYNELRSLGMKKGKRKSMFGENGIVAGTSRKERWLLWPMGVEDAGAMRQWGHHATAFVGRRHFDDVDLFERYFEFP